MRISSVTQKGPGDEPRPFFFALKGGGRCEQWTLWSPEKGGRHGDDGKIFAIIMTAGSFIASVESIVKLVKFIIKKHHESE